MVEEAYKYKYGKPLVKPDEVKNLPTKMRRLHTWYLEACKRRHTYIVVNIKNEHFFRGEEEMHVEFEELFQLYNQDALEKSLVSCYCL